MVYIHIKWLNHTTVYMDNIYVNGGMIQSIDMNEDFDVKHYFVYNVFAWGHLK